MASGVDESPKRSLPFQMHVGGGQVSQTDWAVRKIIALHPSGPGSRTHQYKMSPEKYGPFSNQKRHEIFLLWYDTGTVLRLPSPPLEHRRNVEKDGSV